MITVISHHKVFIISQRNRFCSRLRILDLLLPIDITGQAFSIDIHISVPDLHSLTRHSDDTFDIICIFFIFIRKYNDIIAFRIPEPVTDLINDQIVSIL